ncbi:methyltransferase domain-containing protein [Natrialba aegyptia]|nr:methyltransferase domain-containing protein [Natrialba aegyptia]
MNFEDRERVYGRDEYYWGTEANEMAVQTLEFAPETTDSTTAIDLGAGEGRDAVFFAEQGWDVCAVDVSPNGLRKAQRLADRRGVTVQPIQADANDVSISGPVDVIYSAGAIQYIVPENRPQQFAHLKRNTAENGIHAMFAFVDHPDVPTPPDWTDNEFFYAPGELLEYYDGWTVLETERLIFDDDSGAEPHQHAAELVFARNSN